MQISYKSTRSADIEVTASQAILQGLAPDGGLFVPSEFPRFRMTPGEMAEMDYRELALESLSMYLTD